MEAGVVAAAENAVARLADLGHEIEALAPPFPAGALWESWTVLRSWAVAGSLGTFDFAALKPEAQWEVERGRALSGAAIQAASVIRSEWFRAAARLFDRYDALVLPSAQVWPFPVEWRWPEVIAGRTMDTYHRWMEVVVPVSLIGLPCIALPGETVNGLPHGLQLFGRRGADRALLEIAEGWEAARQGPRVVTPRLT
jgi:amidase